MLSAYLPLAFELLSHPFSVTHDTQGGRHERDCHLRKNKGDGMRLSGNGIGLENTVDYCS